MSGEILRNFALVSESVAVLFTLIGAGAACRWLKLVDEFSVRGIINVLLILVTPAIIVDVFQRPFEVAALRQLGFAALLAMLAHVAVIVQARLLFRGGEERVRPVARLAAAFSNAGFMGLPLEQALFGEDGVFFGIVYVVMFNLFIWSWGLREMRGTVLASEDAAALRKARRAMLINPGTVAVVLSLPLFFFSLTLPAPLAKGVHHLANLNTPLAMVVIGYYLAGANLRAVARSHSARLALVLRLVVFPLEFLAVLWLCRAWFDRTMMLSLMISVSAPVAAMVTIFAARYGRDTEVAVGLVSGTTLLSVLTMPALIALAMALL